MSNRDDPSHDSQLKPGLYRQRIGMLGERLAARHLESLGYRMESKNLRVGRMGELDLVAWAPDGMTLCFIEVKTRTSRRYGMPAEAVTPQKVRRIRRMAEAVLRWPNGPAGQGGMPQVRFDVVEVEWDRAKGLARVHLIPDAF